MRASNGDGAFGGRVEIKIINRPQCKKKIKPRVGPNAI